MGPPSPCDLTFVNESGIQSVCASTQQSELADTPSYPARAPELTSLFHEIAHYVRDLQNTSSEGSRKNQEEPQHKKRKLEHRPNDSAGWDKGSQYTVTDVSFSIPQRKKFTLELEPKVGIRATTSVAGNGSIEFAVNWDSVRDVFCLPLPEKAQAQYNFCVLSENSSSDQILWTVSDTPPKEGTFKGPSVAQQGETYRTLLTSVINRALVPHRKRVIQPDSNEFASQVAQAHRKGETAYHVKAFRGSKDGYLFLLSNGMFWGFKKPLELFAFDTIESVSYTSVLQRTFNVNIAFHPTDEADVQEFEFSMIDQADFAGIDAYVKRHGLHDASMAEQRRAKKLNVNGIKRAPEGDDEAEEGELDEARREAEDLEDEEEEDENFDPGSEGESEGSGSSSGDDEDQGGGASEADLVEEELGSEAENVED